MGVIKISAFSPGARICLFIALLFPQIAGPLQCLASDTAAGNIMFILDASGSMAAKIQGRPPSFWSAMGRKPAKEIPARQSGS